MRGRCKESKNYFYFLGITSRCVDQREKGRSEDMLHTQACREIPCEAEGMSVKASARRSELRVMPKIGKNREIGSVRVDDAMGSYFQHAEKLGILSRQAEIELAKEMEAGRQEVFFALVQTPILFRQLKVLTEQICARDSLVEKTIEIDVEAESMPEGENLVEAVKKILSRLRQIEKLRRTLSAFRRSKKGSVQGILKKIGTHEQQVFDALGRLDLHFFVTETVADELKQVMMRFEQSEKEIVQCRTRTGMSRIELSKLVKDVQAKRRGGLLRFKQTGLELNELLYLDRVASAAERRKKKLLQNSGLTASRLRDAHQKLMEGEQRINRARHRMVESNLKLVAYVARRYIGKGVPFADLVQEGNIGLMKAVDKFDHRMGCKLATYAIYWIRQSITRAVVDQSRTIRLPLRRVEAINRLFRTAHQLSQKLMREPTCEEMAEKMQIDTDQVLDLLDSGTESISLDASYGQDSERQLSEWVQDEKAESPSLRAFENDLVTQMDASLSTLKPREERILRLRFGIGEDTEHTLEEIGRDFQVSRERIRQIESKALQKLRILPKYKPLKSFLES